MLFPERWNFNPVAWMPHAIPKLEDWVRKLATTSSYDERKWRDLSRGKWEAKHHDEEDEGEESILVPRTRKLVEAAKSSEPETLPPDGGTPKKDSGKALESPEIEIIPPPSISTSDGASAERAEANQSAPSEELGVVTMGHSPSLPYYSEEAIKDARAMEMPDPSKVLEEDPFWDFFTTVDDTVDLNDASTFFEEAQRLFSQEGFGEENALRLLCSQKEDKLKDLRADLAKARKNDVEPDEHVTLILTEYGLLDPTAEANTLMSQLQQKLEMIGQLRGKVDQVKADCHRWKKSTDQLATDKEAILDKRIEELEAKLARTEAEVAEAKTKVEKTKVTSDKTILIYLSDAEAVQAELREDSDWEKCSNDLAKRQARRETLKKIHARGFDLTEEITQAKVLETDARFLVSSNDKDVVSGFESGGDKERVPEEEEEEVLEDVVPEDVVSIHTELRIVFIL
ncbi:uncharacterized protein [Nicotiana sylvestris]|uniref:uncharacterized protein n=1 Tax=Nicotiana sylvestris TaxID=4096 RepID=UPI00388CDD17